MRIGLITVTSFFLLSTSAYATELYTPGKETHNNYSRGRPVASVATPGMNEANRRGNYSSHERLAMLEQGKAMLHDLNNQIRAARTTEEREALLVEKKKVEQAMIDVQQMN